MPPPTFRSLSQRRRLEALTAEGKFPQAEFDAMAQAAPDDLPERATRAPRTTRLPAGRDSRYARAAKARLY